MLDKYTDRLKELEANFNLRELKNFDDENCFNLSSNDYLGLASDKGLRREFFRQRDVEDIDFTSSSSRLLTGNHSEYRKLETKIAELYSHQAALVYNSGYHANIGILPALCGKNDLVLADKSVHASIIDGLQLCKATVIRYRHNDYSHLEKMLEKYSVDMKNIFIVTESIFSMDGDVADLQKLVELKKLYKAFLYLDEAHAVGARGENGLGIAEELSLINNVDILVGTFGKALASQGAFVVCDEVIKKYLVNNSRSLIYTTALPPVNIAWSLFIMEKLSDFKNARKRLKENSALFCEILGLDAPQSNIIPIILGENEKALRFADELKKRGVIVLPVRHPTVAKGTARLRFSMTAEFSREEVAEIGLRIRSVTLDG
ncbi:MAG: 8-amino-7-oxononanoate synthase [Bacteroidota bacterium]|nr:8-amino-7-oxononanoate synthase [Bacteroidota bacterium]